MTYTLLYAMRHKHHYIISQLEVFIAYINFMHLCSIIIVFIYCIHNNYYYYVNADKYKKICNTYVHKTHTHTRTHTHTHTHTHNNIIHIKKIISKVIFFSCGFTIKHMHKIKKHSLYDEIKYNKYTIRCIN